MPISKSDFEAGLDTAVNDILKFLSNNKEKAFTSDEISKQVGLDLDLTRQILAYLKDKAYIKSKDIGASTYHIIQQMP
jgi:DNA-binding IscR family transcriptional regulator